MFGSELASGMDSGDSDVTFGGIVVPAIEVSNPVQTSGASSSDMGASSAHADPPSPRRDRVPMGRSLAALQDHYSIGLTAMVKDNWYEFLSKS